MPQIDWTISIGQLVVAAVALLSAAVTVGAMSGRVSTIEKWIESHEASTRMNVNTLQKLEIVVEKLEAIMTRLEKRIERLEDTRL